MIVLGAPDSGTLQDARKVDRIGYAQGQKLLNTTK